MDTPAPAKTPGDTSDPKNEISSASLDHQILDSSEKKSPTVRPLTARPRAAVNTSLQRKTSFSRYEALPQIRQTKTEGNVTLELELPGDSTFLFPCAEKEDSEENDGKKESDAVIVVPKSNMRQAHKKSPRVLKIQVADAPKKNVASVTRTTQEI
ncbi:uncharacterized protein LOC144864762 [Branchiostoma floridae x Branchiostoma japonicum]